MKRLTILIALAMVAIGSWAQAVEMIDRIYTADNKVVEAKVLEVSSSEIRYKDWNNQSGPTFILTASEVKKVEFSNGTVKTYAAASAAVAQPVQVQPVEQTAPGEPAATSTKPAKQPLPVGFQFNIDLDGNLAFLSGSRIRNEKIGLYPIDQDFAVGGIDLTLGAGVRIAEWMFAGVAAGILGEWGNPKVNYKGEEGKAAYAAYTVPIYADVRAYAPTHGNCFPYVEVGLGGYVGIDGSVKFNKNKIDELCGKPAGGFYFLSGVGLEFKYLNIGAGYKLMRNNNFTGNHGYVKVGVSLGRCNKLRQSPNK